jgi:hypothetical protein
MYDMVLDWPNLSLCYVVLSLHNMYATFLDLRLPNVLKM